jgi:hypothetical protein
LPGWTGEPTAEHEIVGTAVPRGELPRGQHLARRLEQRDEPLPRLRLGALGDLPGVVLLVDADRPRGEVDILPAQREQLAEP